MVSEYTFTKDARVGVGKGLDIVRGVMTRGRVRGCHTPPRVSQKEISGKVRPVEEKLSVPQRPSCLKINKESSKGSCSFG